MSMIDAQLPRYGKKSLSVDRNHGSRSELPGGGVRIPRGGHDFRRPGVGFNLFFPFITGSSLIGAEAFRVRLFNSQ